MDWNEWTTKAELVAVHEGLNILGGLFVVGMDLLGVSICQVKRTALGDKSLRFIAQVYPDLVPPQSPRGEAALKNNIGIYALYMVRLTPVTAVSVMRLQRLKSMYRESVSRTLESDRLALAGDHLVHIPDTQREAFEQLDAFHAETDNNEF